MCGSKTFSQYLFFASVEVSVGSWARQMVPFRGLIEGLLVLMRAWEEAGSIRLERSEMERLIYA
jgi:hypothetical protein